MVLLMMPVSRVCAMASERMQAQQASAQTQHDCCPHKDIADRCCMRSADLCHATKAPVERAQFPGQDVSPLDVPPAAVMVVYQDHLGSFEPRSVALGLPMQHAPPGLLIAATTVLRT
jgi:hypothetical protein